MGILQKQGFVNNYEVGYKRKDGTTYDTLLSLTPILINNEPYVQAVVEDITERKRTEQELREAHDTLEERVRARTEDLNMLVNAMAGREVRMAELKRVIKILRKQLIDMEVEPVADDPLTMAEDGV